MKHFQYGVICLSGCGQGRPTELTEEEYLKQLDKPNQLWRCPQCGSVADWDDDSLETNREE